MWANFNSMPKLLKFLALLAAFCFAFFAVSAIPNDSFSIQGRHVTFAEWWSSGAAIFASSIGLVGPFAAWALASKKPYARITYLAFLALAFVAPYLFFGMLAYALAGLFVVGVGAFYMYRWQSVTAYFAPNESSKPTADAAA